MHDKLTNELDITQTPQMRGFLLLIHAETKTTYAIYARERVLCVIGMAALYCQESKYRSHWCGARFYSHMAVVYPNVISLRSIGKNPVTLRDRVFLLYMARSSNGSGYHTFDVMIRVRLPYGLQQFFRSDRWCNG